MSATAHANARASSLRLAIFTDTFTPQVNGVARTLARLAQAVEARGGAVRVETVADPAAEPDARVHGWPSTPFWAYPQLRMAAPPKAEAIAQLRAWRPTLVHAATPFGVGLAGRAAARALGVPLVTSYHTSFTEYLRHYGLSALDAVAWPFLRWFHNSGRRTFAPSQLVAQQLRQQGFRGVRVWSRGVDPLRFHPRFRSTAMREAMGAGPDDLVVAYVGRLAPEKGIHVALEGMHRVVAESGGRVRLALAGDGPDEARCRAMAPPGTWFAGSLSGEALSAFYASADLFVFPSTTETFGNVVLEAMASGLPVVAPDTGATLELASTATAQLFEAGSAASLAATVLALLADADRRAALQTAGLAVAAARTWNSVWDGLLAEYAVVSGARATRAA
ncbi:MAG: glycosyltransferase family 1 protein [Gemmatimonadaceae bacterium]|nr:glycosyltransferase family 1 protein [Gemmatimonadaceae bacterium]MCW5825659.1 glycosyltransferase family 1 protein [Gemmatimonadaceae bacterium]